jgi:hypothetical protein
MFSIGYQSIIIDVYQPNLANNLIKICVQVRIFPLLPAMPTRAGSGRSRPMRARFPTGTRRCRSVEEAHSLLGRRVCAYRER